eukprot:1146939-Pelagomonas_calceolata.AAC.12
MKKEENAKAKHHNLAWTCIIKHKDQSPGDGRVAACLSKRILDIKEGNTAGKSVNKKCRKELGGQGVEYCKCGAQ